MGRFAAETTSGNFVQAPAGSHVARCIRITDLGTQVSEYQGQELHKSQILITWELCHEMMTTDDGEKPFLVSKFYTNSLHEKANLRHDLTNWRGRDFTEEELKKFDLQSILGAPCIVSVVHTDKGKAKIEGVIKLTKGTEAPPAQNPLSAFWLDEFTQAGFDNLSDGIQAIIKKSPEYAAAVNPMGNVDKSQPSFNEFMDDIPF